jgi:hypothetical protein
VKAILLVAGGALIGAGAVVAWLIWYFRDVYR